jgi:hypothetical protein
LQTAFDITPARVPMAGFVWGFSALISALSRGGGQLARMRLRDEAVDGCGKRLRVLAHHRVASRAHALSSCASGSILASVSFRGCA